MLLVQVLDVLHSSYLTTGAHRPCLYALQHHSNCGNLTHCLCFSYAGPQVTQFEAAVRQFTGAEFGVAVSNGTAALHCAVFALGISEGRSKVQEGLLNLTPVACVVSGDEVIVPPLTFAATANAVLYQVRSLVLTVKFSLTSSLYVSL